ncbi:hypothetical protein DH09_13500 [Bacillaceae bacterium JMAK1]|nr:hypothetical protein DH09_13500 [Bacillaceae bacterium JMAK1]
MKVAFKLAIAHIITLIIMIILNYSSATNVGDVANQDQPLIQPAGFAFSIWGVIYVLLLIWILRTFLSGRSTRGVYERVGILPSINFLLNGAWIIAFTQQWLVVSTIIIFLLLLTLVVMYLRITHSRDAKFFDRFPFSMYLGWITVASIANVFVTLVQNDVQTVLGLNEMVWSVTMLLIGAALAVGITLYFKDVIYPLVIVWSYVAIFAETPSTFIQVITVVSVIVILIILLFVVRQKARQRSR